MNVKDQVRESAHFDKFCENMLVGRSIQRYRSSKYQLIFAASDVDIGKALEGEKFSGFTTAVEATSNG